MLSPTFAAPLILVALACASGAQSVPGHDCSLDHPKAAERLHRSVKAGDVKIAKGIAGHTVRYARERYGLHELVGEEDMNRAANQMYDFLKWKLGSPTLVTSQFVTAGYQHFDKGYKDEAASMLLGVLDFQAQEPELKVPPFLLDWVEDQVGGSLENVVDFWSSLGLPGELASQLGEKVVDALANAIARNAAGIYVPKSFDVDNRLVEAAIDARKAEGSGALREPPRSPGLGDVSGVVLGSGRGSERPSEGVFEPAAGVEIPVPEKGGAVAPAPGEAATVDDRIASLRARVERLEALLQRVLEDMEPAGPAPVDRTLGHAAGGFETVRLITSNNGIARLHVSVNGARVGIFDKSKTLDLTPFLVPGRRNAISLRFEPRKENVLSRITATLEGTFADVEEPIECFVFTPTVDHLEDSVEIPVAARS